MDYIVLRGVGQYDGRYEFDIDATSFTTREWGWIKRFSGYLPLTLEDGYDAVDPELFAVFACIAMFRARKIEARDVPAAWERLGDAPFNTAVTLESDGVGEEQEDEAGPPTRSSNGSDGTSGTSSSSTSDPSEQHPSPTGTPGSDSSPSVPPTLAT